MIAQHSAADRAAETAGTAAARIAAPEDESPAGRLGVLLITAAFILLQATNGTAMRS